MTDLSLKAKNVELRAALVEAFEAGHSAWPTPDHPTRAALCDAAVERILAARLTSVEPNGPEIGSLWKASDGRYLRVVTVEANRVGVRNTLTNRLSYVQPRYFNGASDGNWSLSAVEPSPERTQQEPK